MKHQLIFALATVAGVLLGELDPVEPAVVGAAAGPDHRQPGDRAGVHAEGARRPGGDPAQAVHVAPARRLHEEPDGKLVIVDYKTDRQIAADGLDRYRRQLAVYVAAIAQATGKPSSGTLLPV